MFTHKDIEMRTIFVVNCIEHDRSLRVNNGELMLEEIEEDKKKTLTKFPFQKLLALFIIGHIGSLFCLQIKLKVILKSRLLLDK